MSREQKHELKTNATPEEVWRRIATSEGIPTWFAPTANVEPRLGGNVTVGWGPGMEGSAPITDWEPNRHFSWTEDKGDRGARKIEFTITTDAGGETTLTLTHSGFSSDASFDSEYDSYNGGWRSYFSILAHALSVHPGEDSTPAFGFEMMPGPRDALVGRLGQLLGHAGSLDDIPLGGLFVGTKLTGRRIEPIKPGYYLLEMEDWDKSVLGLFVEGSGPKCFVTWQAFLFGAGKSRVAELRSLLEAAFKSMNEATAP